MPDSKFGGRSLVMSLTSLSAGGIISPEQDIFGDSAMITNQQMYLGSATIHRSTTFVLKVKE